MIITDRLTLGEPKITPEGYMAVRARAARSGVYDYMGFEVDPSGEKFKPNDVVKVYRSDDEVFNPSSVRSFLMKPITDNHPSEPVTADNWNAQAKGVIAGAMRDGDYLAFDLVLMDKSQIEKVKSGKRELSNGYSVDLVFEDGVTPDGEKYHAKQVGIRGNHVAVVDRGRAGHECRIADAATCAAAPEGFNFNNGDTKPMKIIDFKGVSIEVNDQAAQAMTQLQSQVDKLIADAATADANHAKEMAAKDAAIAKAEAERDAANAKILDEAALDARVAARSDLIATAKSIHDADYSGKSDADIRRAVVTAKLGDAAVSGKSDAYIDARFDILAEDASADQSVVKAIVAANKTNANDAHSGYLARMTRSAAN